MEPTTVPAPTRCGLPAVQDRHRIRWRWQRVDRARGPVVVSAVVQTLVGLTPPGAPPSEVVLWRLVVPLRHEHSAAHGTAAARHSVLVEVRSADGVVGWGECPTFERAGYVTETTDVAWADLRDRLVPALLDGRGDGTAEADGGSASPSAAGAALSDALVDNELRRRGIGLADHLGVVVRPLERTVVIAGVGHGPDETAVRAGDAITGGAALVKLKIAPGADVEIVEAAATVVPPSRLAVDANGSYESPGQLDRVDRIGLAYIEQPFAPDVDPAVHGRFVRRLRTPVALDESIRTLSDLDSVTRHRTADIVSVKPARVGGLLSAARLAEHARRVGLDVFVGGMVELGIGRAGALVVASMPCFTMPTDLGPSAQYFEEDVTDPLELDTEGRVRPPTGPGIGRVPLPVALDRFGVDRLSIRR